MEKKNGIFAMIYGIDCLSVFLLLLAMILNLVPLVYPYGSALYAALIGWIPLLIVLFRTFSSNKEKRWAENLRFLDIVASKRESKEEKEELMIEDKKHFKYFDCPECNLRIRVPKGKGRIEITCPKCDAKFIKKT